MTVHQTQVPAAAPAEAPAVRLPEQRTAEHDAQAPQPAAAPTPPRGWGSAHDRTMALWMLAQMLLLGLFAAVFVALGSRVW